ncbi:ComF family protein [Brevibacillus sp. SAFN-007a]|uniref:ComF family protein n=1 Tax=Brevibacillus sp. SAFN-007a TaxID=3436862 RepID=UPI003F7D188C
MKAAACVSCGGRVNTPKREAVVRARASRLARPDSYPAIYRLLRGLPACASCLEALPFIEEEICRQCGRDMRTERYRSEGRCRDCAKEGDEPLQENRSLLRYEQDGKRLLGLFKYRGDERLADYYGTLLAIAAFRFYTPSSFACITTVPLHERRLQARGFNQVDLLAAWLGRTTGIPVRPLLTRIKETEKLSKQGGRASRQKSMREAFAWDEGAVLPEFVGASSCSRAVGPSPNTRSPLVAEPLKILLIDDIYTTGSTLRSCARTVRAHLGTVCEIYSLTIYR